MMNGECVLQEGVEEVVVVSQFFYGVEECGEGDAVPANRQFLDMDTAVFVRMEIVGLDLAGVQVEAVVEFVFLAELFEGLGLLLPDVTGLDELVDALQEVVAVRGQVKEGGFVDQNGEQIGDFDLHVGVKLGFPTVRPIRLRPASRRARWYRSAEEVALSWAV